MATRRQVSIFINGRDVENTLKGIYAEKRKITNELRLMELGSEAYLKKAAELRQLNDILDSHRQAIRKTESAWDAITKGARGFVAVAAAGITADAVIQYGKELFRLSAEMELLGAKAETVFGQALPQVTQAAEQNATAMGLTTSQYIDAASAIGDLLIPMGFQREEAAALSTNLVNLSGALSEWTGGQIQAEEVSRILSKALLGEREELKQLGISISEADVQARLAEKGLKGLTGQMLEQAKAAATLELITEKSTDAQAAYTQNADTLVRKQAEVRAQLQQVAETLATALFPVFQRLVGVASSFATGIGYVAEKIGDVVDPAKAATSAFDDQQAKVAALESELPALLSRYDELQGKSELSKEEQEELAKVIQRIGEITPSAITQIDEYGNVLGINAEKSREFYEAEKARLEFVNKEAIGTLEKQIEKTEKAIAAQQKFVEEGGRLRLVEGIKETGAQLQFVAATATEIEAARKNVQELANTLKGAEAELARLRGENLPSPGGGGVAGGEASPTAEDIQRQAARAEELRKQREKQAEQEAKRREADANREEAQLLQKLKRLEEATEQFRINQEIDAQEATEQEIARIRERYRQQIETAKELELAKNKEVAEAAAAQRIELERLQEEEILRFRQEQEMKLEEQRQEFAAQLQLQLSDEFGQRLLQLQEQYTTLLEQAEQYELDTTAIREKYEQERALIEQDRQARQTKTAEEEAKKRIEAAKKESDALIKAYQGYANILQGALNITSAAGKEYTALSKLLAVAQIGIKSAEAIAAATAAAAGIPFPGNLAAIGTAVAAVTANIVAAKEILSATKVPQRRHGGYVDVLGQDDGRRYRAKYIGQPITGMLPGSPVLADTAGGPVLASEAGQEYFVSNAAMRNPVVMNYVRAIDNIARARQFQEGGFTSTAPTAPLPAPAPADTLGPQMLQVLIRLTNVLEAGLYARVDDDSLLDIRNRITELVNSSGGTL